MTRGKGRLGLRRRLGNGGNNAVLQVSRSRHPRDGAVCELARERQHLRAQGRHDDAWGRRLHGDPDLSDHELAGDAHLSVGAEQSVERLQFLPAERHGVAVRKAVERLGDERMSNADAEGESTGPGRVCRRQRLLRQREGVATLQRDDRATDVDGRDMRCGDREGSKRIDREGLRNPDSVEAGVCCLLDGTDHVSDSREPGSCPGRDPKLGSHRRSLLLPGLAAGKAHEFYPVAVRVGEKDDLDGVRIVVA